MKQFLIIFREPDGRKDEHPAADIQQHRQKAGVWMKQLQASGNLLGGHALTLNGAVVRDGIITSSPYTKGDDEIVGGYMLVQASCLQEAAELITTCPILDFGAFAEVRECI